MSRFYFAIAPGDFAVRIIGYRAKIVQKPLAQYSFVRYAKRRCRADLLTTESKEVNTFRNSMNLIMKGICFDMGIG